MNTKLYIILFILVSSMFVKNVSAQVAVIANKAVSAKELSADGAKSLYILDSKSIGASKALLFDIKSDNEAKKQFYKFIGITPDEAKKIWFKAKLTGSGEVPQAVTDEDEMVKKVAATAGGIGYVSASKVTADVKVLVIIQ